MEDKFLCALVQSYLMLFESIIQISDTTDEPIAICLRLSWDDLLLSLIELNSFSLDCSWSFQIYLPHLNKGGSMWIAKFRCLHFDLSHILFII